MIPIGLLPTSYIVSHRGNPIIREPDRRVNPQYKVSKFDKFRGGESRVDSSINSTQLTTLIRKNMPTKMGYDFLSRSTKVGLQKPMLMLLEPMIVETNKKYMLSSLLTSMVATLFLLNKEIKYVNGMVGKYQEKPIKIVDKGQENSKKQLKENLLFLKLFLLRILITSFKLFIHTKTKLRVDLMKGQRALKYAARMTLFCGVADRVYYQTILSKNNNFRAAFKSFLRTCPMDYTEWFIFYSAKAHIETSTKRFLMNHLREKSLDSILEVLSYGVAGVITGMPSFFLDIYKLRDLDTTGKISSK